MSLRGFGFILDIKTGTTRHWYLDSLGVKRWVYGDSIVDTQTSAVGTRATVSVQRQDNKSNDKEAL
jgi:hypothetical protein